MKNRTIKYIVLFVATASVCPLFSHQLFQYAVIGGGPAGITTVSQLLEHGVSGQSILWIDPEFKVGRLGKYYQNVPSNSKAHRYVTYLTSSNLFNSLDFQSIRHLKNYDADQEPYLFEIVAPLQDITQYLQNRVTTSASFIENINYVDENWELISLNSIFYAQKVILAIGSHPKRLTLQGFEEIPMDIAIDQRKLGKLVSPHDTVIVIGSSHSAMLILKYLSEIPVKQAINFYTKNLTYDPIDGLAGITATWTKEVLEKQRARNVTRVRYSVDELKKYRNQSCKIIYAFGFEQNPILINGSYDFVCDHRTGKIMENLYGIGIAFPDQYQFSTGTRIPLIGVNSFTHRAQHLMKELV